jgi:peptide/nickel transport system permease protein
MDFEASRSRPEAGQRLLRYVLVLLVIITINFLLPRVMPGDPLLTILGERASYDPEHLAELRARMGLDGPLWQQYLRYLGDLARGDLGYSFTFTRPVSEVMVGRIGWTLLLILPSVILGAAIGLVLGALAGWRRSSRLDLLLTAGSMFFHSVPHYWVAMLTLTALAFWAGWFPLGKATSGYMEGLAYWQDVAWHLVLPLGVVTLFKAAYDFAIVRNSVVTTAGEEHVLAAQARGTSTSAILVHHVLRNSLAPLVTITALQFGTVFAGTLLVEVVFSWPGMGTLIYDAVSGRDYPLLQATFLLIAACVIAFNFIADLLYAWLDPRVR